MEFSFPKKLFEKWPLVFVDFCAGGSPFRKRTRLLFIHCGNPDPAWLRCQGKQGCCSFSEKKHLHISGRQGQTWMSKLAEPYPLRIAAFIGDTIRHSLMLGTVARLTGRLASSRLGDDGNCRLVGGVWMSPRGENDGKASKASIAFARGHQSSSCVAPSIAENIAGNHGSSWTWSNVFRNVLAKGGHLKSEID